MRQGLKMNVKHLISITRRVKLILEEYPETRNDDNLLWWKTIEMIADEVGEDFVDMKPFKYMLLNFNRLNFPTFETVSRTRRKVQEKYPELKGTKKVQNQRAKSEQAYREYARL